MLYSEFVTGTGIENHDLYQCVEQIYNSDEDMTKGDAYYIATLINTKFSTLDMYFQVKLEYEKMILNKEIAKKAQEIDELEAKYRYIQSIIAKYLYGQIDD